MSTTTEPVAEQSGILEQLFATEYTGMVRLAYTLVGSNAEAEDLVQDSFVEVSRRLDEIRKPGAYLRSAVVSRCRSALRRRRVIALHPPEPSAGLASDAGELWDVLGELPEDQRFTSTSDADAIRSGLVTASQAVRWSGMRSGIGELEGMLIHELGWGEVVEGDVAGQSTVTGVIQMTEVSSDSD